MMKEKYYKVVLEVAGKEPEVIGYFLTRQRALNFKNSFVRDVEGCGSKYNMYIKED